MPFFGGTFSDFLEGPWDQAKGYLREHLEQLTAALNAQLGAVFNGDNTLTVDAIGNPGAPVPSYVANTGVHKAPRWDKVDVASGVKNRLKYANLTAATTASLLLGRGSDNSGGDWQEITVGDGLEMNDTTLKASTEAAEYARIFMLMGA